MMALELKLQTVLIYSLHKPVFNINIKNLHKKNKYEGSGKAGLQICSFYVNFSHYSFLKQSISSEGTTK